MSFPLLSVFGSSDLALILGTANPGLRQRSGVVVSALIVGHK